VRKPKWMRKPRLSRQWFHFFHYLYLWRCKYPDQQEAYDRARWPIGFLHWLWGFRGIRLKVNLSISAPGFRWPGE
jgi:hypothetical protein